jgi:hypothetical protein
MSLLSRQSLQNKQCFHNLYTYLSAARNKILLRPNDNNKTDVEKSLQKKSISIASSVMQMSMQKYHEHRTEVFRIAGGFRFVDS